MGLSVGMDVGALVGFPVGASVGAFVGLSVGAPVGISVGATVGASVGLVVGRTVGLIVGFAVGLNDVGDFVGDGVSFMTTISSSAVVTPSTPSSPTGSSLDGASDGVLVAILILSGVGRKVGELFGLRVGSEVLVGLKVGDAVDVGDAVTGAVVVGEGVIGALLGATVGISEGCFVAAYRILSSSIITEESVVSSRSSGAGTGGRDGPRPGFVAWVGGPVTSSHLSVNPPSLLKESRQGSGSCARTCVGIVEGDAIAKQRTAKHFAIAFDFEERILCSGFVVCFIRMSAVNI